MQIAHTRWRLESMGDGEAATLMPEDVAITLSFEETQEGVGRVAGSSGVNRYFAPYTLSGGALHIGPLAGTRMAGPEEAMRLEAQYIAALEAAERYELDGEQLILTTGHGMLWFVAAHEGV